MSSSIMPPGENWFSRLSGLAGKAPAAPAKAASVPAAAPSPAPASSPVQDQIKLSGASQASAKLNSLVSSLPPSDLALVKSAASEEKLIKQLVAREFPGLKLNEAQMQGLLSFVQQGLQDKGFNLAEIQKGLKALG